MSFLDAARTVLADAQEPLHYKELTARALQRNLVQTSGLTPWDTMAAQLSTQIKRYGDECGFCRVKPAVYALVEWGLEPEPARNIMARSSHLPSWEALRGFVKAVDGREQASLTSLRGVLNDQKGKNNDYTKPEQWCPEVLEGAALELALAVWTESNGQLNPRYVATTTSVANTYDLVEQDDDGVLHMTERGRAFVTEPEGPITRELDQREGVARVLALVAEHGPASSGDLLAPYMAWGLKHAGFRSEATGRVSLHSRLQNLMARGLVNRRGHQYSVTSAGMAHLGHEMEALVEDAADTDKDELFELVREINEQKERVRARIFNTLRTMDPYAFEHLIKRLLREMGYDDVEVTKASNDKGVDVVGSIEVGITSVKEVIQAKRQKSNVGRPVLDALRGSLYRWSAQRGTIITTAGFTKGASSCAFDLGTAPIQLIDGERLVDLLVQYGIGVNQQPVKLWRFDAEAFTAEGLGVTDDDTESDNED